LNWLNSDIARPDPLNISYKKMIDGVLISHSPFHPDKYGSLFSQQIEQVSDGEVFEV